MCDQTRELVGLVDEHDSGSTHHWTYEFKTFCALNSRLKMFDCRVFTLSYEFSMRNQYPSFCLNAKGLQMKWLSNNNSPTFKYQVVVVVPHQAKPILLVRAKSPKIVKNAKSAAAVLEIQYYK